MSSNLREKAPGEPLWYKEHPGDKIWWKNTHVIGDMIFSFDRKTEYNYFTDLDKLTPEQRAIFDKYDPLNPTNFNPNYKPD